MAEPPVLRLVGKSSRLPTVIKLSSRVTFGRGENCDVAFDDPERQNMISREHAQIVRLLEDGKEVFQVEDLDSRNGVLVNFLRVNKALLHNGDKITFGGAGKRKVNTIVSHPNSAVVYEFRWRSAPVSKKRSSPGERETAVKKRKTNDSEVCFF
eukprot:TRINITY_DN4259_c0_g1_i3.p1 TRINITY_DN4259_c0_g1~~TRINITY_DN4259_c0_g1_i3.p1  ORF type:complete len:154 (+),score=21.87 TRINITY_DN4259_c0_g1_i3:2-463(+)